MTAQALTIGKITGLSSLGQPLQAEIDLPSISAAEAASLSAAIAGSDSYAKSGLEYSPSLANAQISLQRRSNGQAYLRLTTAAPVSDPFVNLVVELTWEGGRAVRDFTLLLDPANVQMDKPAVVNNSPLLAPSAAAGTSALNSDNPASNLSAIANTPIQNKPAATNKASTKKNPPQEDLATLKSKNNNSDSKLRVKRGQTAGQIARQLRASNTDVSLDQMLVALVRNNPDAFINGNVNLIKSGAVLDLPTAEDAQVLSAADARKMVVAQSKDFKAYRRQLAGISNKAPDTGDQRQTVGQVQAQVKESKPSAQSADKLTLSKPGAKNAESQLAQKKQAQENTQRAAEVAKNNQDLNQLAAQTGLNSATSPATASPATGAGSSTTTPATSATPSTATAPITSAQDINALANAETPNPPTEVATVSPAAPTPPAKATPEATEEPSFFANLWATLTGIPNLLPGLAGLLLIALGWLFWRNRQKAKQDAADLEEDYVSQDTDNSPLIYSDDSGQLQTTSDAADERTQVVIPARHIDKEAVEITQFNRDNNTSLRRATDPIAEAQVYLDFGREQEAKETLESAFEVNPAHVPVALKLLDVYGRMGDQVRFGKLSSQVEQLTGAQGKHWQEVVKLASQHQMALPISSLTAKMAQASSGADSDSQSTTAVMPTSTPDRENFDSIDLTIAPSFASTPSTSSPELQKEDFEAIDLTVLPTSKAHQPLNVNLSDFSLDLNTSADSATPNVAPTNPWATKLMLAKEFKDIGDVEGAKTIAQEVLERTTDGALKAAAQDFLNTLKS